jgi:pimeloyl-ACP methyl ester carboxylesterase
LKVYFISGLGADRSIFKHIHLPAGFQPVYLDWIPPQKDESLSHYAQRLIDKINTREAFSLVGLSMGGMLAVEIARTIPVDKVILISSIPTSKHLPPYYRWMGALQLHQWLPIKLFQKAAIIKRLFTAETPEDKRMLKAMIRNVDVHFLRWGMGAILSWDCSECPPRLFHIHGTHDEILPKRFTQPTHLVRKAGHLMVLNRSAEINNLLATILTTGN